MSLSKLQSGACVMFKMRSTCVLSGTYLSPRCSCHKFCHKSSVLLGGQKMAWWSAKFHVKKRVCHNVGATSLTGNQARPIRKSMQYKADIPSAIYLGKFARSPAVACWFHVMHCTEWHVGTFDNGDASWHHCQPSKTIGSWKARAS